jgi:hypothetical protein
MLLDRISASSDGEVKEAPLEHIQRVHFARIVEQACQEPSPYDYKKQFAGLEWYDREGAWRSRARNGPASAME